MELKLLVIRTKDSRLLAAFYTHLGLHFEYHQHGKGPFHYSASVGAAVFEIYPLTKSQTEPDKELRLGFSLNEFDNKIALLKELQVEFIADRCKPSMALWRL